MPAPPHIIIHVNGASHSTQARTVAELARELSPAPQSLLVEHNQTALHRSQWEKVRLRENDRIEILRIAAGG